MYGVEKNVAVFTGAASWPAKSSTYHSASLTKFDVERVQEYKAKKIGVLT